MSLKDRMLNWLSRKAYERGYVDGWNAAAEQAFNDGWRQAKETYSSKEKP